MNYYLTSEGDVLDIICYKAYGTIDDAVLTPFLRANSHLLAYDTLKGGENVYLPDLSDEIDDAEEVDYLWQ